MFSFTFSRTPADHRILLTEHSFLAEFADFTNDKPPDKKNFESRVFTNPLIIGRVPPYAPH